MCCDLFPHYSFKNNNGLLCSGTPFAHRLLPVQCLLWPSKARCFFQSQIWIVRTIVKPKILAQLSRSLLSSCPNLLHLLYILKIMQLQQHLLFVKCYCRGVVNLLRINISESQFKGAGKSCMLVCSGYRHRLGGVTNRRFIFSQFCWLEVPGQGPAGSISREDLLLDLLLDLQMAVLLLYAHIQGREINFSFLIRPLVLRISVPPLWPHNPNYFLKTLSLILGVRASTHGFWEYAIQSLVSYNL